MIPLNALSTREYQSLVFSLLVEGTRAMEIAARLGLSPKTVDTYRVNLMRKLDIHDLASLVKFAMQRDLNLGSPIRSTYREIVNINHGFAYKILS